MFIYIKEITELGKKSVFGSHQNKMNLLVQEQAING